MNGTAPTDRTANPPQVAGARGWTEPGGGLAWARPGGRPARLLTVDVPFALLLWALSSAELGRTLEPGSAVRPADPWGYLLVAAASLPIALRRRYPRVVLSGVLLAATAVSVAGYRQSAFAFPLVVALYTMGARVDLRGAAGVLAGLAAFLGVSLLTSPDPVGIADFVQTTLIVALAWWLGASLRVRAAYAAAMEERAALLQRVTDDAAAHAVVQERLRIARELHDVVAHSMSVVAVQSGVALHVLDSRPDQARTALGSIVATSRSSLAELRRLLGVLRQDGATGALEPSPGLADLGALTATVAGAGLRVDVRLPATVPPLPPGLELTVYRIVQEALTNVVKHAGHGASATVTITCSGGDPTSELAVEIVDSGGSAAATPVLESTGVGLIGMRERVAVFGGRLEAGPTGEGFRVRATLPLPGASDPAGATEPAGEPAETGRTP